MAAKFNYAQNLSWMTEIKLGAQIEKPGCEGLVSCQYSNLGDVLLVAGLY